jgi:hypothetical protein
MGLSFSAAAIQLARTDPVAFHGALGASNWLELLPAPQPIKKLRMKLRKLDTKIGT